MTPTSVEQYAALGVVVLLVGFVAVAMLVIAHTLGPKRHGPVKDSTYESGMPVLQDTRRRFNVRFYIVAVLFLLFDVEIIFIWPWAKVFHHAAATGTTIPLGDGTLAGKGFLLAGMGIFFILLVFGLIYEWRKGAFQWE
ncbi:MAG: NADH-quinone oxidoreductase subunit A [Phycisphaerae bacterium]|nr:NADH-quinone oxidoreductase subunit A [Phycisphaerae bacterium]